MSRTSIPVMCLMAVALAGCGEAGPPTTGAPVQYASTCDKANDGKRVSVEGYLGFPRQFRTSDPSTILRVRTDANSTQDALVGVSVRFGGDKNQVQKPGNTYTDNDLKVLANDGKQATNRTKVRVHGTVGYPSAVATIEFKCRLDNPMIELVGN